VSFLGIETRRAAYVALVVLTVLWGANWVVMKLALASAHPVVFTAQRTWVGIAVLFVAMAALRLPLAPQAGWTAIVVTGLLQTTVNFGSTTMALAGGGAGRTSVLVFTMPFWTLVIARLVLGERVRGAQWVAVGCALAGLVLVVAPWDWRGDLAPKLWATLSGLGWACFGIAVAGFAKSIENFNYIISAVLTPLFLLAGTFFPISTLPEWAQVLAQLNPLHQCVELVRSAVFGWEGWVDLARLGALVLFGLLMWRVAIYAMQRKLVT